jgi:hypothetical protein
MRTCAATVTAITTVTATARRTTLSARIVTAALQLVVRYQITHVTSSANASSAAL